MSPSGPATDLAAPEPVTAHVNAANELRSAPVTPSGSDRPGNATYLDENSQPIAITQKDNQMVARDRDDNLVKAGTVVTQTVDDGKGNVAAQKFEVARADTVMAPQAPGGNAPAVTTSKNR